MKAAPFTYIRADSVADACRLLAAHGDEARLIAGGQSLVPLMAMRMVRPEWLVDINAVDVLNGAAMHGDTLVIGAMTRQAQAERAEDVARHAPLLARALPHVGHRQTRNRGTIGGSLAQADPAGEIPLVAVTLGATLTLERTAGTRTCSADMFIEGPMATTLDPDECLTSVAFPIWRESGGIGAALQEVAMRDSDFALAAAAVQLAVDHDGICRRAVVGVGGVGPRPRFLDDAAGALVGTAVSEKTAGAAAAAAEAAINAHDDLHASAAYRRRVAVALIERAILAAHRDALAGMDAS